MSLRYISLSLRKNSLKLCFFEIDSCKVCNKVRAVQSPSDPHRCPHSILQIRPLWGRESSAGPSYPTAFRLYHQWKVLESRPVPVRRWERHLPRERPHPRVRAHHQQARGEIELLLPRLDQFHQCEERLLQRGWIRRVRDCLRQGRQPTNSYSPPQDANQGNRHLPDR